MPVLMRRVGCARLARDTPSPDEDQAGQFDFRQLQKLAQKSAFESHNSRIEKPSDECAWSRVRNYGAAVTLNSCSPPHTRGTEARPIYKPTQPPPDQIMQTPLT